MDNPDSSQNLVSTSDSPEDFPRDKSFNPGRYTRGRAEFVVRVFLDGATHKETRQRKRRPKDQAIMEQQVECIAANVIHRYLTEPDGWVAITQSKQKLGRKGRYNDPVMTTTLPRVLKALAERGLIDFQRGSLEDGKQSTLRASRDIRQLIDDMELTLDDIGSRKGNDEEVIILKRSKNDIFDKTKPIEYADTTTTVRYRTQLQRINAWLSEADISVSGMVVDTKERRLQRIFNDSSFEKGGRLYGGFWQGTKSVRKYTRINGNPVVTLDYGQTAVRIAYSLAKVAWPAGLVDAYEITLPFGHQREGVKKVLNAMLNKDRRLTAFPKGTREMFDKRLKIGHVTTAILKTHSPIAHIFHSGNGLRVMFRESQIMLTLLEKLMAQGIVALPIHDAVIVERADALGVEFLMATIFKNQTNVDAVVRADAD